MRYRRSTESTYEHRYSWVQWRCYHCGGRDCDLRCSAPVGGSSIRERKTVIYDWVISHCRGANDCDVVQVPFEVETGNDCAKAVAEFSLDGRGAPSIEE